MCICVWISTVTIYCERQLICLECGSSVTFFNLSATAWMRLICCQIFIIFLEEDLKGAGEKNSCTTGYFPTLHELKSRLPAEKQATKIHTCLVFRKLTWIWQNVIHIADTSQDNTKAQTSFYPILREFLPTGFSVPPPVVPIRTHLSKFCYAKCWLHRKSTLQIHWHYIRFIRSAIFLWSGKLLKYAGVIPSYLRSVYI